jgi:hypothetical protein
MATISYVIFLIFFHSFLFLDVVVKRLALIIIYN